jgi:hypothetical protein
MTKEVEMSSATQAAPAGTAIVYDLEGTLLEACSCGVLCPCWIGEDPDGGSCDGLIAYHFDRGTIRGVDVAGLSIVNVAKIPGNVLAGNWKVAMLVSATASDEQLEAIVSAYSGRLGGPLADLAGLVGEVVEVRRVPITHEIRNGRGTLVVDGVVGAEMGPYAGPDGTTTTLRDSIFSTVPGSPAYVGKASRYTVDLPEHGMQWTYEGRNAIQADYRMTHAA